MGIVVAKEIFESFPKLQIGVLVVYNLNNHGQSEQLTQLLRDTTSALQHNLDSETVSEHPRIACWREAFSSFKAKPQKYRSSIESLCRTAQNGSIPGPINKIVDIYNIVSMKHLLPLGGDDLDSVSGDIKLCYAKGDEPFQQLNSQDICCPKPGEIIYCDETDVLCRRWNWRECNKSKMTKETQNICLVAEALPPAKGSEVERALAELSELIKVYCGGKHYAEILSTSKPEMAFP